MKEKKTRLEKNVIDLLTRRRIGELADLGDELATCNISELAEMLTESEMDDEINGEVALSPRKNPGEGLTDDRFAKLDADSLYVVQLCAIGDEPFTRWDLLGLSEVARSMGEPRRHLTKKRIGHVVNDLLRDGFVVNESYSRIQITPTSRTPSSRTQSARASSSP